MLEYAIAIAGLSALCVLWWVVQRAISRADPSQPEYRPGGCAGNGTCGMCGGQDGACSTTGEKGGGAKPLDQSATPRTR